MLQPHIYTNRALLTLATALLPSCRSPDLPPQVETQVKIVATKLTFGIGLVTVETERFGQPEVWYGVRHRGPLWLDVAATVVLYDKEGNPLADVSFTLTKEDLNATVPRGNFRVGRPIEDPNLSTLVQSHFLGPILWVAHTSDPSEVHGFSLTATMDGYPDPAVKKTTKLGGSGTDLLRLNSPSTTSVVVRHRSTSTKFP